MPVVSKVHNAPGMLVFDCPGCQRTHAIYVAPHPNPTWDFNGDYDKPTFMPSLLVRWDEGNPPKNFVCHSFIKDGNIEYLNDCTHELAGKTVALPQS